VTSTIGDF